MTRNKRENYTIVIEPRTGLFCLMCIVSLFAGCKGASDQRATALPIILAVTPELLPTPLPRPEFVYDVSPPESRSIPLSLYQADLTGGYLQYEGVRDEEGGYDTSVCVVLSFFLLPCGEDPDCSTIPIQIAVDSVPLVDVTYDLWLGYTYRTLCWHVDVGLGNHRVDLQLHVMPDDVRSYTWYFALTGESVPLATFTPWP